MPRLLLPLFFAMALLLAVALPKGELLAEDGSSYRAYVSRLLADPPAGVVFRADLEAYLNALVSSYRVKKKRPALAADRAMRDAARAQAFDMMQIGKSSHRSLTGLDFRARFKAFFHADNTAWANGENAASDRRSGPADQRKAQRLFQSWVDSTGHRRNLLNGRYAYVSTGVVQRGNELWSVQIFWSEPITGNFIIQP